MSERFHKTYISAREFLESWDKEIYELTNLDYFIYLMVNHIGNQLDKRFFTNERSHSPLYLEFDSLGNLCFNIGDSFEFFLEEDYLESSSSALQLSNLDYSQEGQEGEDELPHWRVDMINALLKENIHDQRRRLELMQNAVFDTLIQFYYEEIGIEIDEDNLELLELAEFIVDVMFDFIHAEGKTLLERAGDPAMDYFEELLDSEEGFQKEVEWEDAEEEYYEHESEWGSYSPNYEDIGQVIQKFIEDRNCNPPETAGCVACDIELFEKYLTERVGLTNIYEVSKEHLLEFMSVWLVQEFAQEKEPPYSRIFQAMARFVTWLAGYYQIDHKRSFLHYYESVKTEVPRVLRSLNKYLLEYNLFEVMMLRNEEDCNQVSGFFEITHLHNRHKKTMDLVNLQYSDTTENVYLNSSIYSQLKPGDILQATLLNRDSGWEVLEIHYIYPRAAKPFVH